MRPVLCIAGPTASGKSSFAIDLAKTVDGEIINADALQVYSDLQILSARPTDAEMQDIPHHLFGHINGETPYSTGQWVRDAVPTILEVLSRHKTPILVGGTGLYFKALFDGIADIPGIDESIRDAIGELPIKTLRQEAESVDPVATARVLGDDPQRLGRIVSVFRATDRPLSGWQAETRPIIPKRYSHRYVMLPNREILYARINQRFDRMMEDGALEEAKSVYDRSYPLSRPMMKAIGLAHLLRYFRGEMSLPESIELAKRDSRRLAKRQMTWFRNQMPDWIVFKTVEDRERLLGKMS